MDSYKNKILGFYSHNRRMPSYAEIMTLLGFKSKNAVYKLVNKLVGEGVIRKDASGRLVPERLANETPLLGLVEAGLPSEADAVILDTIDVHQYLFDRVGTSYLLRVKGDSMIEAGIHEGDLVLAERTNQAKPGDIVIACIDGGWTMKHLRRKGDQTYLEPANRRYKPIYPTESFEIGAVVKGVIRRY